MKRLVRAGQRHLGRFRGVRRRQASLLILVILLCLTVVAATALGWLRLATSLESLTVGLLLVALAALLGRLNAMHRATLATARDTRAVVEQTQRRLVAAVEKERLAGSDRYQALEDAVRRGHKQHEARLERLHRTQIEQLEALTQLFSIVALRAPLPPTPGAPAEPSELLNLVHEIQRRQPRLVLDLGGGRSAVWLAYALEKVGGRLVTLHHDPGTAEQTRTALAAHRLGAVAEVRAAPLRRTTVDGRTFRWYDTAAVADLTGVDLLVVAGPPEATGPDARFPAVLVLADRLAPEATVVLQDTDAQRTADATRRWIEAVPQLSFDGGATGRQAVLSYVRSESPLAAVVD